ncbi:hypothetical protein V1522DRAFT_417784 [Lipomyces starkeyi]
MIFTSFAATDWYWATLKKDYLEAKKRMKEWAGTQDAQRAAFMQSKPCMVYLLNRRKMMVTRMAPIAVVVASVKCPVPSQKKSVSTA